jgi:hypothetical protein
MKTKTFLLLCLILGNALTKVSAQSSEIEKNHSYSYTKVQYSFFPVYCNNVLVETFKGDLNYHIIDHYKNGVGEWGINLCEGEFTSKTGEVFRVNELDKYSIPTEGIVTSNMNLVGNEGTHYILSITWNAWPRQDFIIDKAVCLEKVKE